MQENEPTKVVAELKKEQEPLEEAELPYFCVTCRKSKGTSNPKRTQGKSKQKKSTSKNLKRNTSAVSKKSPKSKSSKEATASPESSEKEIQEDPAPAKKELAATSSVQSKSRRKCPEMKNNTSQIEASLPTAQSSLLKDITEENGNNSNKQSKEVLLVNPENSEKCPQPQQ